MTMFDPEVEMMLELARLAPEPGAAARARNLAALRARLALPVPPTANVPAPVASPLPAASPLVAVPASLRQLVGVGIVTGAIGFFVGLSVNRAVLVESTERAAPLSAAATAAPVSVAPAPPAPETRELATAAPALGVQSVPEAGADATVPEARVAAPVAALPPRALAGQRRGHVRAGSARPDETASFFEAVQLLRRARNALQKGEAALALSLLEEMDARFPRELLDEERGATRVLGLCASGASEAAQRLAAQLRVRYPRSIYAHRLEQSCAGSAARGSE